MTEATELYIKQVQSSFLKFISLHEDNSWLNSASTEDIKTAFKLANFVEKSARHFEDNCYLEDFLDTLNDSRNIKQCDKNTFFKAGDILLCSFFSHQGMTEFKLDLAIRMYTSQFSADRLDSILTTAMLRSSSYEAVLDFSISNCQIIGHNNLHCILFLSKLIDNYTNNTTKVKEHISSMVSLYKIETYLDSLIGILALPAADKMQEVIRKLILDALVSKMYDRSVVSKPFWLCLLRKVNKMNVINACENFKVFLESLCSFIMYIGSMMQSKISNGTVVWCSNPDISICPEVTYSEMLDILKCLHDSKETRQVLHSKIDEVRQQTDCPIWHSVELDLKKS